MKLKKVFIAIMLCIFMCMSATACADPFDDGQDGENEVANKVTLRVGILNEPGEQATMRKLKSEFEKINDKINIKIEYFPGTYEQSLATYIRKPEDMPDIIWVGNDKHAPFSSAGHFVNLRSYYEASEETALTNYYDEMIEQTKFSNDDKGIWYAPRDYNKPVTIINKKLWNAAGIEIPTQDEWNYEKFLEVCAKLRTAMDTNTDEAKKKLGLVATSYPLDGDLHWQAVYHSFVEHFGGELIKNGTPNLNGKENLDAYKKMRELITQKYCTNPATDTADLFLKKGAAMWFSVRPRLQAVVNAGLDVDFLPFPLDKIGVGNSGYAITTESTKRVSDKIPDNKTPNSEYAWEFIKWIITEPGQEVFGSVGTGVPVLKSLKDNGSWTNFISKDLNHAAFTAYSDTRDISLNKYNDFPQGNHFEVAKTINGVPLNIGKNDFWSQNEYKSDFLEEIIKLNNDLIKLKN